jgi:hypothetical protein
MNKDDRERWRIDKYDSCEAKRIQKMKTKYEKRMFLSLFFGVIIDTHNPFISSE